MPYRYFIELAYKGTHYSGFQIQDNAVTIQGEVQKALKTLLHSEIILTGSSRTDAGVHALQNFFHFDYNKNINDLDKLVYQLNAILPNDLFIKNIFPVKPTIHARFSALTREYKYFITTQKDPFRLETAYHYTPKTDVSLLQKAAEELKRFTDFTSFSKLHTQVQTNNCKIEVSQWLQEEHLLMYNVKADRFLRGMVRALVATMLKVGAGKISLQEFITIIESQDCTNAWFDAPAKGLFLVNVDYGNNID